MIRSHSRHRFVSTQTESLECRVLLAAGDPDPTFNGTGTHSLFLDPAAPVPGEYRPTAAAHDSHGRLVVLAGNDLVRYTPDGAVDAAFGNQGFVHLSSGADPFDVAQVAIAPDDGVIVSANPRIPSSGLHRVAIYRLTSTGAPDTTFGVNGVANPSLSQVPQVVKSLAVAADGSFFIAADQQTLIAKFTPAGSLDSSFGTSGIVRVSHPPMSYGHNPNIALLSDGRIILAFLAYNANTNSNINVIQRYTAAGGLDLTFHSTGGGQFPFVSIDGLAVQSDNKAVVIGYMPGGTGDTGVTRLNADGTVDNSFHGGTPLIVFTGFPAQVNNLKLESDGKILLERDEKVARITTAGALDSSFGNAGIAVAGVPGYYLTLEPGPNNVVDLIGGLLRTTRQVYPYDIYDLLVAQLQPNGSPDSAFATNGYAVTRHALTTAPTNDAAVAIAAQADGKIIAAGISDDHMRTRIVVVRFNADGSLDPTFGTAGILQVPLPSGADAEVSRVALQADGKIVVGGNFLMRLLANGLLDTSFLGTGIEELPAYTTVTELQLDSDSHILVGKRRGADPGFSVVVRLNRDGSSDTSFNGTGQIDLTGLPSYPVPSFAIQPDGRIVVAARGIVQRFLADGSVDTSFGTQGIVALSDSNSPDYFDILTVKILTNGQIVAAGNAHTHYGLNGTIVYGTYGIVFRLNASGSVDTSFGMLGIVYPGVQVATITVEPAGRILIAGDANIKDGAYGPPTQSIERLNPDGTLDATFGTVNTPKTNDPAPAQIELVGGKIYAANLQPAPPAGTSRFAVTRLLDYSDPTAAHRVYRVYNVDPAHPFHLLTTSQPEFDHLVAIGWRDETTSASGPNLGISFEPAPGTLPLHRLYNGANGLHYFTTSDLERDALVALPHSLGEGWAYEGDIGYVFASNHDSTTHQIFHLYNKLNGEHLFLTDAQEAAGIQAKFPDAWTSQSPLGFGFELAPGASPTPTSSRFSSAAAAIASENRTTPSSRISTDGQSPSLGISPASAPSTPPEDPPLAFEKRRAAGPALRVSGAWNEPSALDLMFTTDLDKILGLA